MTDLYEKNGVKKLDGSPLSYFRLFLAIALGILSAFAFLSPTLISGQQVPNHPLYSVFAQLQHVVQEADRGMVSAFFAVFLIIFYKKTLLSSNHAAFKNTKPKLTALIFSAVLSIALLVGESFRVFGNFDFIWKGRFQLLLCGLLLMGYIPFFYTAAELAVYHIDKLVNKPKTCVLGQKRGGLTDLLLERRPFLIPMLFIMLCWLPVLLIYFPGTATVDGIVQVNQALGLRIWNDHHPVLGSLIYGCVFRFGILFGSDDLGLFSVTLFQSLSLSAAFAFAMSKIRLWGVPNNIRLAILLFWAFNPVFPYQTQALLKDNFSTALLILFVILFADLIRNIQLGILNRKKYLQSLTVMAAVGILASLIRHNNLYLTAISLIVLVFLKQEPLRRTAVVISAVICFAGAAAASNALVTALDAKQGEIVETLSIPLQQTARFVRDYPEEVTSEEEAAIDAVLFFDNLAESYNPDLSDPVKVLTAKRSGYKEALPEYFRCWISMGLRKPLTYIEATTANTYAYFAPVKSTPYDQRYAIIHHNDPLHPNYGWGKYFEFKDTHKQPQREGYLNLFETVRKTPGLNLFFQLAHYTWFLAFLVLLAVRKGRRQALWAFIPAVLVLLMCIASPVNGDVRYFLPVLAAAPLLAAWSVYSLRIPPKTAAL